MNMSSEKELDTFIGVTSDDEPLDETIPDEIIVSDTTGTGTSDTANILGRLPPVATIVALSTVIEIDATGSSDSSQPPSGCVVALIEPPGTWTASVADADDLVERTMTLGPCKTHSWTVSVSVEAVLFTMTTEPAPPRLVCVKLHRERVILLDEQLAKIKEVLLL